jgi:transcriptional regulator with XRE-family HTH domain
MIIDLETMTQEQYEAYRDECDARSSAEFRMRRELCGIELAELADELGVRIDTAKRWENPNKGMPPSVRAWAYIDSAYAALLEAVGAAVQQVEDTADALGEPREVHVAYRRGNQPTRDGLTVGRSNAVARASALALTVLGYAATAEWADEGAAGLAARAPRK